MTTDDHELGAPPWKLQQVTTPAELKKVIVDAVTPLLPAPHVRVLLDVDDQQLHVQITTQRPAMSYDEVVAAIFKKFTDANDMSYDELTKDWPPGDAS